MLLLHSLQGPQSLVTRTTHSTFSETQNIFNQSMTTSLSHTLMCTLGVTQNPVCYIAVCLLDGLKSSLQPQFLPTELSKTQKNRALSLPSGSGIQVQSSWILSVIEALPLGKSLCVTSGNVFLEESDMTHPLSFGTQRNGIGMQQEWEFDAPNDVLSDQPPSKDLST